MLKKIIRKISLAALAGVVFAPVAALSAMLDPTLPVQHASRFSAPASGAAQREEMVSRLMIKPRALVGDQLNSALVLHDASALTQLSGMSMSVLRPMSGGAHVIRLAHPVTLSEARALAQKLMLDSRVELAEPDRIKHPLALVPVTPTDPDYASYQWNLFVPSSADLGSINMPNAWTISGGSNSVTVAVIDTGYRPHQDFGFTYSGSSFSIPVVLSSGYTFITDLDPSGKFADYANNGVGRETDALDYGDWVTGAENMDTTGPFYGCGATDIYGPIKQLSPSSWHGTHVTGILAAQINNGIGIAGIAPNIQVLPVRVLGKCGGTDSDIIDGMRWAAGFAVPDVPNNTHPAQVLSMSLGTTGGAACSAAYQSAINDIIAAGKVIAVAAGNDGTATLSTPANCSGVIAVTANSTDGDNAWYATVGNAVAISAPGGDCGGMTNGYCDAASYPDVYSTLNSGTTTPVASPGGDIYAAYAGTSMATPHVAGVAALMLSINPSLTPAQILSYLQSTARPFPPNTVCTTNAQGLCGAGLLDAYQALSAVAAAVPLNLAAGWNLVGNGVNAQLPVTSVFPIAPATTTVSSIWEWLPANGGSWAFYTPTASDGGATYATSKGYTPLTTINAGEGYWVNTNAPLTVSLPSGSAILSGSFQDSATGGANPLPSGWSLIAVGDNPSPLQFVNAVSLNPPQTGAATSINALWAWDSSTANWYFYSPSMDNLGTLGGYIKTQSFKSFSTNGKTLGPTTGFWVNHP